MIDNHTPIDYDEIRLESCPIMVVLAEIQRESSDETD